MSSSGGVFTNTLQSITTTKLNELSKKRKVFEDQKTQLLHIAALEPDQKQKLRILVDGVKKCFALKTSTKKRGDRHGGAGSIISGNTNNPRLEICMYIFHSLSFSASSIFHLNNLALTQISKYSRTWSDFLHRRNMIRRFLENSYMIGKTL